MFSKIILIATIAAVSNATAIQGWNAHGRWVEEKVVTKGQWSYKEDGNYVKEEYKVYTEDEIRKK